MSSNYIVRQVFREDMEDLLVMIEEVTVCGKRVGQMEMSVEDLIRNGGFNAPDEIPEYVCFVAEDQDKCEDGGSNLLGYAMCFNSYSTWQGKALHMKDIYVRAAHRRRGVGRSLFKAVAKYAQTNSYKRLDYHVLSWNTVGCDFYKSIGAVDMTETEDWALYRKILK